MRPLEGKRILVTRADAQACAFSRDIASRGGTPIEVPVIAFRKPEDQSEICDALNRLTEYSRIIFTSANGIRFFFDALKEAGISFPSQSNTAVVGRKTMKVLQNYGIQPDLVPDDFVAESLLDLLKHEGKPGEKILLPRGNLARKMLPVALAEWGASVTELTVYETVVNKENRTRLLEIIRNKQIDVVTFTSSSTVRYFFDLLNGYDLNCLLNAILLACIGPITAKVLSEQGYAADILPEEYTTDSLLKKIEHFYEEAES